MEIPFIHLIERQQFVLPKSQQINPFFNPVNATF
jgi:hypothetical protein